ncbi:MAG: IS66 family insertion sequence element accessory protein TnpA [Bryobacteraceae bacterium]
MGKLTRRAAEMERVVEEYAKSGLRRREFCERRGIALTTLDYWRREHAAKPRLVKVEVATSEPAPYFTLALANGRRIESSWRFGEEELARLIRIAERA